MSCGKSLIEPLVKGLGAVMIVSVLAFVSGCASTKTPAEIVMSEADGRREQIQALERYLIEHPGVFDWKMHNELRHLYSDADPRRSLEHSDVILKNSPMDDYILNILSGWQIDKDAGKARANLLMQAKSSPDLKFVNAACMIKIGDLYAAEGDMKQAATYYNVVSGENLSEMIRYRVLVEQRLKETEGKP